MTATGWEADEPPKTWVRAKLRFAPTAAALEQAAWVGPGPASGLEPPITTTYALPATKWYGDETPRY